MRVSVDYDKCESNGLCVAIASEFFEIRDDDVMYLLRDQPTAESTADAEADGNEAKLREAVRACPKQALTLHE